MEQIKSIKTENMAWSVGISNYVPDRHFLMFYDIDSNEFELVKKAFQLFKDDLILYKTKHGYHLISFQVLEFDPRPRIARFSKLTKQDYWVREGNLFLRVSEKIRGSEVISPKPVFLEMIQPPKGGIYSERHLLYYVKCLSLPKIGFCAIRAMSENNESEIMEDMDDFDDDDDYFDDDDDDDWDEDDFGVGPYHFELDFCPMCGKIKIDKTTTTYAAVKVCCYCDATLLIWGSNSFEVLKKCIEKKGIKIEEFNKRIKRPPRQKKDETKKPRMVPLKAFVLSIEKLSEVSLYE